MKINWKSRLNTSPGAVVPSDGFAMRVVAVVYPSGVWSALCGPSDQTDDFIANHGSGLREETARRLFYVLAASGLPYEVH